MRRTIGLLVAAGIGAAGCGPDPQDFQRPLPGGYTLIDFSHGVVGIAGPRCENVLGPSIDLYALRGAQVFGHVVPDRHMNADAVEGFFVLDTQSGKLLQGLSSEEWRQRLGGDIPTLAAPVRQPGDFCVVDGCRSDQPPC